MNFQNHADPYPPAFHHGDLQQVFPDIFMVSGTSIFEFNGSAIQKSNNMVVVRSGDELTLINTLRLNEDGIAALQKMGHVKHIVRIGAFHDRNDAFYRNRYRAKLWAIRGMKHKDDHQADREVASGDAGPIPDSTFFVFETTMFPEGILCLEREGGILITCDSVKNWTHVDSFFSDETGQEFLKQGLIAQANIDAVWRSAMNPQARDFQRLRDISFKHLLSAHGEPLLVHAKQQLLPLLEKLAHA